MLKTGAATPSSTLATGSRSKETVINSPWIKSDVANEKNSDEDCSETQSKESDGDATSGQSCVRTRAQKRKLSFKENREVEVSLSVMFLDPRLFSKGRPSDVAMTPCCHSVRSFARSSFLALQERMI